MIKMKRFLAGALTALLAVQIIVPSNLTTAQAATSVSVPDPIVTLDFDDETIGQATAVKTSWTEYTGTINYDTGRVGSAISLTSSEAYGLKLNQENVGANYTVSMWIKHDSILAENQQILFLGSGSPENWLDVGGDRNSSNCYEIWTRNTTASTAISGWNYLSESAAQITGEWVMLTVTGDGTDFHAYINGEEVSLDGGGVSDDTIANAANVLNGEGQDIYIGINYWDSAFTGLIDDVTVYDSTLTEEQVQAVYETQYLEGVAENLDLGDLSSVTQNLTLPTSEDDVEISWASSNEEALATDGTITRMAEDTVVTLTATFTYKGSTYTKDFTVTVAAANVDADLQAAADALTLCTVTAEDLDLPSTGKYDSTITWSSSDTSVMKDDGTIVSRPAAGAGNAEVTLTATITLDGSSVLKEFTVEVMEQYYAYVYGYITGDDDRTGSLHLAYSTDGGETYTALNSNSGILYVDIDTNNSNKTLSTGYRYTEISLFRKADGTFGVAAPQGLDQSYIYLYDSEDLLTYTNETCLRTNSSIGNISDVVVKYDAAGGCYNLYWTAGGNQYANVLTDSDGSWSLQTAAAAEYTYTEVSAETLPDDAKNGSVIGITKAEYNAIMAHFSDVTYTDTTSVEDITVETAADLEEALPDTVSLNYSDGSSSALSVTWDTDSQDLSKAGTYTITGTVSNYTNPLIEERADPYIVWDEEDQCYYFTASYPAYGNVNNGYDRIILRKADTIEGLADAEEITIWTAPSSGTMAKHVWAPEIHKINGTWYVFFAAGNSDNIWAIRPYVLVCQDSSDAINPDSWVDADGEAEIHACSDKDGSYFNEMSLDMTYFEWNDHSYVIWADIIGQSALYMQEVDPSAPWEGISEVILLSTPEYGWERENERVNEGASILINEELGRIYCTFSASGTGSEYCIGLLYADLDSDLMDPDSWTKLAYPILTSSDVPGEYGPGHNTFTVDADGNYVFVYHARSEECYNGECAWSSYDSLYDPCRHARVKNVHWTEDGFPILNTSSEDEVPDEAQTITVNVTIQYDSDIVRYLEDAEIDGLETTVVETGAAITQDITVTWGTATLTEGKDYTATYENNVEAGTATLTITAVEGGRYTGSRTVEFTILPYLIADLDFDTESSYGTYTGGNAIATSAGTEIELVANGDGYAASFTSGDYLDLTALDGSSLLAGYEEITISYDINISSSNSAWVYYAAPSTDAQSYPYEHYIGALNSGGTLTTERYNNNGSRPSSASAAIASDTWTHVDVVYTTDATMIYVDGELQSTVDSSYKLSDILGDDGIFYIGKANWGSGEYSTMLLDNFRIVAGTSLALDTTALDEAIAAAEQLMEATDSSDYTAASWQALTDALAAAESAKETYTSVADQALVNSAAYELEQAMAGLVDISELKALYDENKDTEQGNYTESSYQVLTDALADAAAVLADEDASQDEADAAYETLKAAIDALETIVDLAEAAIAGVDDYAVETGSQITPEITVTSGDATLTEGEDYTVTYGANTEVGTGTVTITATDNGRCVSGSTQTVEFTILPYLIAYLDFDTESSDGTYSGWNALVTSAGSTIDLVENGDGYAASFTSGDYLNLTALDGSSLLTGYEEITISYDISVSSSNMAWIYYAAPSTDAQTYPYEHYIGALNSNGTLTTERYNNNGSRPSSASATISSNTWTHVDVVYTTDATSIYIDGELKSTVSSDYLLSDILGDSGIFQIGKANWGSGEYSTMVLDNFQIVGGTSLTVYTAALDAAIAEAEALLEVIDSDDYTAESYQALTDALDAAKEAKETCTSVTDQETVNNAAEALEAAMEGLTEKSDEPVVTVDKTALAAAVADAEAAGYAADDYTEASYASYEEALAAAKDVLADETATQSDVDSALASLNLAIAGLEEKAVEPEPEPEPEPGTEVDKSALETAVADAEAAGYAADDYTEASYASYEEALAAAKDVLGDADATQTDVDDALDALNTAIAGLEEKAVEPEPEPEPEPGAEVDKSALQSLVESCDANYEIWETLYTEESMATLDAALATAKAALENADVEQDVVDAALAALNNAIDGLVEKTVDKSDLQAAVADAEAAGYQESEYTLETWADYEDALTAAKAVLAKEDVTQDEVDEALANLNAAIAALATEDGTVDTSELESLINSCEENYDTWAALYTEQTMEALDEALAAANAVLADENATQEAVDEAYTALADAVNGLEVKTEDSGDGSDAGDGDGTDADTDAARTKLQTLYDASSSLTQGSYTDSSYAAFESALANAAAVLEDEDATAEELAAAYDALVSAIEGLTVNNQTSTGAASGTSSTSSTAKTGDTAPVAAFAAVLLMAALIFVLAIRRRRQAER